MPTYRHQRLAENAKRKRTSLNQYLVVLLSERDSLKVVQSAGDELAELKAQLKTQLKQRSQPSEGDKSQALVEEERSKSEAPEQVLEEAAI